jgi:hypothetical protein
LFDIVHGLVNQVNEGGLPQDEDPEEDAMALIGTLQISMRFLFKTSGIARKATRRDRYAQAMSKVAPHQVEDISVDDDIIRTLFPRLRLSSLDWLRSRMAEANNRRRRYLRYCADHQHNIADIRDEKIDSSNESSAMDKSSKIILNDSGSITSEVPTMSSATTINADVFKAMPKPDQDEIESIASGFSYETDSAIPMRYDVVDLQSVNDGHDDFVCCYCRQEVTIKSPARWKYHVMSDLQAYVCTAQECVCELFKTSHAWLQHQLSSHLTLWRCIFCHDSPRFQQIKSFEDHLRRSHASQFEESHFNHLCKISEQEPVEIAVSACMFCDWQSKLQDKASRSKRTGMNVVQQQSPTKVSLQQYRKHVCAHMEQIALSVLDDAGGSEEESSADEDIAEAHSETDSIYEGSNKSEFGLRVDLEQEQIRGTSGTPMLYRNGTTANRLGL